MDLLRNSHIYLFVDQVTHSTERIAFEKCANTHSGGLKHCPLVSQGPSAACGSHGAASWQPRLTKTRWCRCYMTQTSVLSLLGLTSHSFARSDFHATMLQDDRVTCSSQFNLQSHNVQLFPVPIDVPHPGTPEQVALKLSPGSLPLQLVALLWRMQLE